MVEYSSCSLEHAVHHMVWEKLSVGDGGLIAVDKDANVVMDFNTVGMFRGGANSKGFWEVKIWKWNEHYQLIVIVTTRSKK